MSSEPKLGPPGSGLPAPQKWIAPLVVPIVSAFSNIQESKDRYRILSEKIVQSLSGITLEDFNQQKLVPKINGLEDSSRFWSAAMTEDHLLITGNGFRDAILMLSKGTVPPVEVRIENVKPPKKGHDLSLITTFAQSTEQLLSQIDREVTEENWSSATKLRHPWFGPLNARQWLWLMSIHQGIHLKQIRTLRSL